ncbi:MAG: hydrogenase iron-sulfur subunit [Candidatus Hermodarchaeota archaeon]
MKYKILIISTPGVHLNDNFTSLLKKITKNNSVIIIRQENTFMLDINELLRYFYEEFDGIFIISLGEIKTGVIESKHRDFQNKVKETNRILAKRGLTDGRIKICSFNGKNYRKLNNFISQSFKNLIKLGLNPLKFEKLEV